MANAEKANSIAPEQYGSRKHKSAIKHALNKALLFDMQRQRKEDTALMTLDAEACYDRIPLHVAALCLRRQGLPVSAARFMFQPIYEMDHTVRTGYGTSTSHYSAQEHPLHGILQGNGAGPCIWVMVSSPLFDHLRALNHGATTNDSVKGNTQRTPVFAFVDDADAVETTANDDQPLTKPQALLTTWGRDLRTIGGNLKWSKCFWQWLKHKWSATDRWSVQSIRETDDQLIIITATGTTHVLERAEITKGTMALGIMFSANGSMKDEVLHLRSKGTQWADKLRTAKITKTEAWFALNQCILRTIHYPLLATTISKEDFGFILSPILKVALPKSGICRNMPRAVVYSSRKYRGLGIANPWVHQGISKLLELIGPHKPTETTRLMYESFRLGVRETGLGPSFLQQEFNHRTQLLCTPGIISTI
jgi:hypothetical protein